ncbi:Protein kinase, putative [Penicillium digitatum PHI26]|uniref:Protein kinase, putative n=2 Tax=Penicillium digitatum TaxID=36651 RepID=K9FYV3_PEND2|nr:Protein kinase, putative [Penicillium digitatum Pd1]EKV12172.1 Protein kinase, putative [Penicillium digitatum Pd1]EKV14294.1 Protein kinase, putative [Penicillium digitatum PHI26]
MVSFEGPTVLGDFLNLQLDQPIHCKIDSAGRPIYRSHNEFGPIRNMRKIIPKIVDFGGATTFNHEGQWGLYPIQPDHYRAPEVILGCGWKTRADIWNLGVLHPSSGIASKERNSFARSTMRMVGINQKLILQK